MSHQNTQLLRHTIIHYISLYFFQSSRHAFSFRKKFHVILMFFIFLKVMFWKVRKQMIIRLRNICRSKRSKRTIKMVLIYWQIFLSVFGFTRWQQIITNQAHQIPNLNLNIEVARSSQISISSFLSLTNLYKLFRI